MKDIICILVLYNPEQILLQRVISSVICQVDFLWISDNSLISVDMSIYSVPSNKFCYKKMNGNIGIAAAQNYGIKYALDEGFKYILFLDQDSILPPHIVSNLKFKYQYLISQNINVGGVGPSACDRSRNKEYKGLIYKGKKINSEITEVKELISSSLFTEVSVFKNAGLMEEKLFIDNVDHEWCWRATYKCGSRFFVINSLKLEHQIGEGGHSFMGINVITPTPFRVYYQYRNYLWLLRCKYAPLYWKCSNAVKFFFKAFYLSLFMPKRIKYLKRICLGIYNGIFDSL